MWKMRWRILEGVKSGAILIFRKTIPPTWLTVEEIRPLLWTRHTTGQGLLLRWTCQVIFPL